MKLLLVIDLQNAFINRYTVGSIKKIEKLIAKNIYDKVCFTRFINSVNNPLYKKLNWKECISENSRAICIKTGDNVIIDKITYSAYNDDLIKYISDNNIDDIYLCGIDIGCCVLATALNLFENDYNIFLLKDYCFSMRGKRRKNMALKILESNIGKNNII